MKKKIRIAILTCYIGKLPWYFEYFALSCKYNESITFFIITDDTTYKRILPPNIQLIFKTLSEINELATEKLGFKTNITTGYKLCDFKPTFGLLFSDLFEGFDFWGHGDIDIIYGNIRNFITDEVLKTNDIIAVRDDFLTGYFLLFKNNETMKFLFIYSKDYKKVLTSSKHYCFDETNFHFEEFEKNIHYSKINSEVESMTHVVKKLAENKIINAYFDFHVIEGAHGKLFWDKGKLFYRRKFEAILYHLILFKNIYNSKKRSLLTSDSFNISPTKIYFRKSPINGIVK